MLSQLGEFVVGVVASRIEQRSGRSLGQAPTGGSRVAAAYRDRSKRGFAGRWRHGHVRERDAGREWVPGRLRGIRRVPIALTSLRVVGERAVTGRESWLLRGDLTVLSGETAGGPVELAIPQEYVPFLRQG